MSDLIANLLTGEVKGMFSYHRLSLTGTKVIGHSFFFIQEFSFSLIIQNSLNLFTHLFAHLFHPYVQTLRSDRAPLKELNDLV